MKLLLKILFFTALVPGTATILVPTMLLRWTHEWGFSHFGAMQCAGIAAFILGVFTYAWCAYDFGAAGKGTPAPIDPPKTLVIRGLYRYSRNPMYLGILGCLFGEALFFESLTMAVYGTIFCVGFNVFVRFYEEPKLRALFGSQYEEYCERVPRWIPRAWRKDRDVGPIS